MPTSFPPLCLFPSFDNTLWTFLYLYDFTEANFKNVNVIKKRVAEIFLNFKKILKRIIQKIFLFVKLFPLRINRSGIYYFCIAFISRSRNSTRRIFPEVVFGRSSTNSILRGYLYGAVSCFTCS